MPKTDESYPRDTGEDRFDDPESGFLPSRQVYLRDVSRYDYLRSESHPGKEHLHLFRRGVLGFIQDDAAFVQRPPAHVGKRCDLDDALVYEAQELVGLKEIEKSAKEAGVVCEVIYDRNDSPYDAIIRTAEDKGCDLIMMASHGRRGVEALLLGSETQKVLTHSKIPVLVYR